MTIPLAGAAAVSALALAYAGGLRVNASNSMPVGIWTVAPATQIVRGEAVVFCATAPEAARYVGPGACPNGLEPLVKPVAAMAGDVVTVTADGIAVNGQWMPNSAALVRDEANRGLHPVPAGTYRVEPGFVWLLSGHDPRSFDSRYFGPVPLSAVMAVARPLLVWR